MRVPFHRMLALFLLVSCACPLAASPTWSLFWEQKFDGTGNPYSSQNDTNGFGLFAQVYDNFTVPTYTNIAEVRWTGAYFNPPQQGPITGWTISFYTDNHGQPGNLVYSWYFAGTGGETFLGFFGGFPTYTYDIQLGLNFGADGPAQYWVSLYPDLGFPPQWGWSQAVPFDNLSYQDFFGARSQLDADMAFSLYAGLCCGVPEPGTLLMAGAGVAGLSTYYAEALWVSTAGFLGIGRRRRRP